LTTVAVDEVVVVVVVDEGLVVDDEVPVKLEAWGPAHVTSPEPDALGAVQATAPTSEALEARIPWLKACWRSAGARLPPTASHTTRMAATPVARDPPNRKRRPGINRSPARGD
jgi:hypothetical protein